VRFVVLLGDTGSGLEGCPALPLAGSCSGLTGIDPLLLAGALVCCAPDQYVVYAAVSATTATTQSSM